MTEWVDCEWYENCLGDCRDCTEKGNPYYEPPLPRTDPNESNLLKNILLQNWFGVKSEKEIE